MTWVSPMKTYCMMISEANSDYTINKKSFQRRLKALFIYDCQLMNYECKTTEFYKGQSSYD